MHVGDAVHDGESHARPLRLRRVEGLEHPGQPVLFDPDPVVDHRKHDAPVLAARLELQARLRDLGLLDRLSAVQQKVDHDLLELDRIALNDREPLGEPFEIFDDWGRFRTEIYFDENGDVYSRRDGEFDRKLKEEKLTTREIDATGAIAGSGDPNVDGEVKNAVEMMHRIGGSARARQSFIRHLFRFFMGRNEMLSDSQTLVQAEKDYLENGGSFKALVVSLLTSDSFLYRR